MKPMQTKKKTGKKIALIVIPLVALVLIGVLAVTVLMPLIRYHQALSLVEDGKYEEAYFALLDLGDYKDSKKLLQEFEILYDARTASDGSWERYVYDEKGRRTKLEERTPDGEETVLEYVYNDLISFLQPLFSLYLRHYPS